MSFSGRLKNVDRFRPAEIGVERVRAVVYSGLSDTRAAGGYSGQER